ncbi:MAG: hypothetical protein ACYS1E_18150 [Planctomycetota bacterium]|jgi:hypothetical protein
MGNGSRGVIWTWIVLAAYLASTVAFGRGVILCQEPDGRTVVELGADRSHCLDGPVNAHDHSDGIHAGPAACSDECCDSCPCVDTLLAVEPAPVEKKISASLALPAGPAQPWLSAPNATALPCPPLTDGDRVTLRALRSVVLLV